MRIRVAGVVVAAVLVLGAGVVAKSLVATDHHHRGLQTIEHGGGLDQCGGHTNSKTGLYHYHRRKC